VRLLLLSLISIAISACGYEGPTGYKAGPSYPGDSNLVRTCDEETFMDKWWDFHTGNAVANTLVPSYKIIAPTFQKILFSIGILTNCMAIMILVGIGDVSTKIQ